MSAPYPRLAKDRDTWILAKRRPRNRLDPWQPYGVFHEIEPDESRRPIPISTILLTNRECPWRCLMCDLWRNTLEATVPEGAIAGQIAGALARLPASRWIKLYNAGSFFDPKAIPPGDHRAIAETLRGFERVIVESHPALVGPSCLEFRDALRGSLEVAMGLETIHPEVLPLLNKRMTAESFRKAAAVLREAEISVRAFVLIGLPFVGEEESIEWACRSVEFAFDCGASVVSIIPTRTGNGAMEALASRGEFSPPDLAAFERAFAFGLSLERGRVLADLWNLGRLRRCKACFGARADRLRAMNLAQTILPEVSCGLCGAGG